GREGHAMDRVWMRHGAHDGDAMHFPRQVGQQFAHVHSWQTRRNGLEFTPNLLRGIRLHVKGFKLARRAVKIKKNASLGLAEMPGVGVLGRRLNLAETKEFGQAESQQAQAAGLQEVAASWADAQAFRRAKNAEHFNPRQRGRREHFGRWLY